MPSPQKPFIVISNPEDVRNYRSVVSSRVSGSELQKGYTRPANVQQEKRVPGVLSWRTGRAPPKRRHQHLSMSDNQNEQALLEIRNMHRNIPTSLKA